jgi:hypothetical protein
VAPVTFFEGLPNKGELEEYASQFPSGSHWVLTLDDLMAESGRDATITAIYTTYAHHWGVSLIEQKQNLYAKGPHSRTQSLQCAYFILTKNKRDQNQIAVLGIQLYPSAWKQFLSVYQDAMESPTRQYPPALYVSVHPWATPPQLRLMSHFLPPEGPTIVYRI